MDVDIILEPDLTPRQICELGTAAEGYGIRALWTSNYFAHWDGFLSLLPLVQQTKTLKVGPLAVSPFEMHPLKMANSLLTLNEMSGGRAQLAMGAGEGNLDAMDLNKPPKIVRAIREAAEIVIAAGTGGLTNGYRGEDFNVNFPCGYDWLTEQPPFIYVTCYREQMMRMAGRVADGVYLGAIPPELIDDAMKNVNLGKGRRKESQQADIRVNSFWGWHMKPDLDVAYRESRRELAWRGRKLVPELVSLYCDEDETKLVVDNFDAFVQAYFDRSGEVQGVPESICRKLMHGLTSTGNLDDLDREIERFKTFERAGLTELSLRLHEDPMEALDVIGKYVVPALRD
jgi:hypothetical protein